MQATEMMDTTISLSLQASLEVELDWPLVKIGLIGGPGGSFNDIRGGQRPRDLEKVQIWTSANGENSSAVITGIRFTYIDVNDKRRSVPIKEDAAWGSTTGNAHEFKLDTSIRECVTRVDGSIGLAPDGSEAITSLKFTSSAGKTETYGDPKNGKAFSLPLSNAGIVAFYAGCGDYINALGFYAQTAYP